MTAEEQHLSTDKAELMSAIEQEWNLLMDVIAKLDSESFVRTDGEGLSPKDHLAHLAEWMKILIGYYIDHRPAYEVLGVASEVTREWDFEARNQLLFERNRQQTVAAVLEEVQHVHAEVVQRLNEMSFDKLLKPRQAFDPAKRPLLHFVLRGTAWHFAEHRKTIEKNL